jgi:hypothetical protein
LNYERVGRERLEDVRVLCLTCHGKEHPQHRFRPQREIARARRKQRPTIRQLTEAEEKELLLLYASGKKGWAIERAEKLRRKP